MAKYDKLRYVEKGISPDHDEAMRHIVADAWVRFAAASMSAEDRAPGSVVYHAGRADAMTAEFLKRFMIPDEEG